MQASAHLIRPTTTGSLYVGDLDPSVQEETLNHYFKQAGPISSIRVCRDSQTRQSLGYAYVNFHNIEDAERALNLLNYQAAVGSKPWRIMWSHRDPSIRKSGVGNVFIKNLHKDINQQQLYDLFSSFGNILSCKVAVDDGGRSKGFGFIHFETKEAAEKAIESTNALFFENKPVYVGHFIPADKRQRNNPEEIYTNVYIKNISDDTTKDEFKALVSKFGSVTSIFYPTHPDGKFKGFGFANFSNHNEAESCVKGLDNFEFKKSMLKANRAMKRQEREEVLKRQREENKKFYEGRNLYVKNLDEAYFKDEAKFKEEFEKFGTIRRSKIVRDPENNSSKGFGYVCYDTKEEAKKAIESLNGHQFGNKNLYVALFQSKEERKQHLLSSNRNYRGPPYYPASFPIAYGVPPPRGAYPYPRGSYQSIGFPGVAKRGGSNKPRAGGFPPQVRNPGSNPKRGLPAKGSENTPMSHLASLAHYDKLQRRQIIGDSLYQQILQNKGDNTLALNLTSIILNNYKDVDDSELIALIEDPNELKNQMEEAFNTLEKGRQQQQ